MEKKHLTLNRHKNEKDNGKIIKYSLKTFGLIYYF